VDIYATAGMYSICVMLSILWDGQGYDEELEPK